MNTTTDTLRYVRLAATYTCKKSVLNESASPRCFFPVTFVHAIGDALLISARAVVGVPAPSLSLSLSLSLSRSLIGVNTRDVLGVAAPSRSIDMLRSSSTLLDSDGTCVYAGEAP